MGGLLWLVQSRTITICELISERLLPSVLAMEAAVSEVMLWDVASSGWAWEEVVRRDCCEWGGCDEEGGEVCGGGGVGAWSSGSWL